MVMATCSTVECRTRTEQATHWQHTNALNCSQLDNQKLKEKTNPRLKGKGKTRGEEFSHQRKLYHRSPWDLFEHNRWELCRLICITHY